MIEDRGLRFENGESTDSMHFSILHSLRSSILDPQSSILDPLSTAVGLPKLSQRRPAITAPGNRQRNWGERRWQIPRWIGLFFSNAPTADPFHPHGYLLWPALAR